MVYNEGTNLVVCVSVAIGPARETSNFGRLFMILIENTSVVAEFEYRLIKMPPTPHFTLVTSRGQRSILRSTTNPTRGQYHSNGTTLILKWNSCMTSVFSCLLYRSVNSEEILNHLCNGNILIALTDWSKLNCKWCNKKCFMSPSMGCLSACPSAYQGELPLYGDAPCHINLLLYGDAPCHIDQPPIVRGCTVSYHPSIVRGCTVSYHPPIVRGCILYHTVC